MATPLPLELPLSLCGAPREDDIVEGEELRRVERLLNLWRQHEGRARFSLRESRRLEREARTGGATESPPLPFWATSSVTYVEAETAYEYALRLVYRTYQTASATIPHTPL